MASIAKGVIHWLAADVATTTYTVSGLSFQPTAIMFFATGLHSATSTSSTALNLRMSRGFAVSTSSRRNVAVYSLDGAATSDTGNAVFDDCCVATIDGAAAVDGKLDLSAINSDGFTMIVDDQVPVNNTVMWVAFGGTSVASILDITEPAATGNVDYTVTGFDTNASNDQIVFIVCSQSSSALNTVEATDSGISFGAATGSGAAQFVISGNSDDASAATTDCDHAALGGEVLNRIAIGGGGPDARASLTQFNTNNFRLNWAERKVTGIRSIALALKGGKWTAGHSTIDSTTLNNTAAVSGLAYQPEGIFVVCIGSVATATDASSGSFRHSVGLALSTSDRVVLCAVDRTGVATTEIGLSIGYEAVGHGWAFGATVLNVEYDISAIAADGFTMIVDNAGGTATDFWGYVTFTSGIVIPVFMNQYRQRLA